MKAGRRWLVWERGWRTSLAGALRVMQRMASGLVVHVHVSCAYEMRMKGRHAPDDSPPAMPALASDGFAEGASLPSDAPDLTRRWISSCSESSWGKREGG